MLGGRHFKCSDCGHGWEVPYGTGLCGQQMECPKCRGDNLHRADVEGRGRGQCSRPRAQGGVGQGPEFKEKE